MCCLVGVSPCERTAGRGGGEKSIRPTPPSAKRRTAVFSQISIALYISGACRTGRCFRIGCALEMGGGLVASRATESSCCATRLAPVRLMTPSLGAACAHSLTPASCIRWRTIRIYSVELARFVSQPTLGCDCDGQVCKNNRRGIVARAVWRTKAPPDQLVR